MTKVNNKGFLLAESLVVSTFVLTVLTLLFVQFKTLFDSYKNSYNYNKVEAIYNLGSMANYYKAEEILDKLPEKMQDKTYLILYQIKNDPKGCNTEIGLTDVNFCNSQAQAMDLKTLIYTSSSINTFKNYLKNNDDSNISQSMKDFINKISLKEKAGLGGRLYAQFNDGSFATISTEVNINGDILTPERLKDFSVTSGDGLYVDEYESNKYTYRGINPNNYILFNNELWRILSINSDNTLKIMKDSSIGEMAWDEATGDTSGPRYNKNNTYCKLRQNKYNGCNVWAKVNGEVIHEIYDGTLDYTFTNGTVTEDSSINKHLNNSYYNSLSTEAKANMVKGNFNFGFPKENASISEDISLEKKYIWNGYVGLITVSEYLRLSQDKQCNTIENSYIYKTCTDNYIYKSIKEKAETFVWTISGGRNMWHVYLICNNDAFSGGLPANPAFRDGDVRPVVYLNNNITLSGTGTLTDPYIIL